MSASSSSLTLSSLVLTSPVPAASPERARERPTRIALGLEVTYDSVAACYATMTGRAPTEAASRAFTTKLYYGWKHGVDAWFEMHFDGVGLVAEVPASDVDVSETPFHAARLMLVCQRAPLDLASLRTYALPAGFLAACMALGVRA